MIAGAVTKATVATRCLNLHDWHGSVVAVFHAVILLRAGFSASLYQFGVPAAAAAVLGVSVPTQTASQSCVLNEALRHRGECCSRYSTGDCNVVVSVACVRISACMVEHLHRTFQLTCIPCSNPFQAHPWQLTQLALCVHNYVLASICFDNSIGIVSCNTIRQNRIPVPNGQARPFAVPGLLLSCSEACMAWAASVQTWLVALKLPKVRSSSECCDCKATLCSGS